MDWNCVLLGIIIGGCFLYIIYSVAVKLKSIFFTPITRGMVFNDLESRDGFSRLAEDSEEYLFLRKTLDKAIEQYNGNQPVTLKKAVCQKDNYDYYISEVQFDWSINGIQKGNLLEKNCYLCLLISAELDVPESIKITKKSGSLFNPSGNSFHDKYSTLFADSKTAEKFLFREVRELFEQEDGRYPMTDSDANEYPGPMGRTVIICNEGIIITGNSDGDRYNMAEMLEFGKKLLSLIKAITDSEEI